MTRFKSLAVAIVLAAAAFVGVGSVQTVSARDTIKQFSAYDLYVDPQGNISLPENFQIDWTFMGSWAVADGGKVPEIHNVYAPKEVIEDYKKNGEFSDGAILVKEARHARGAQHTTGLAHWVGDVKVWFVMVRDKKGRFPNNPLWGEGWGWALFNGDDRKKQVATDFRNDCLGCHVPAKDTDWTYIYAYPVLGDQVAKYAPARDAEKQK